MKTVGEVLGTREAYWVAASWPLRRVVEYMCEKQVGAVPVLDESEVVGVFSERDLMKRVVLPGLDPHATTVAEVMTKDVISTTSDVSYLEAKALMLRNGIRHLVVLDRHNRLTGFLSIRDLSDWALKEAERLVAKLNDDYYNMPGGDPID